MRSPRIALTLVLALIAVALGSGPVSPGTVHASDHRDAPLASVGPGGDISDYYSFVTYSGPPHSPFLDQITVTTGGSDLPGAFNVEIVDTPDGGVFFYGDPLYTPPSSGSFAAGGIAAIDRNDPALDLGMLLDAVSDSLPDSDLAVLFEDRVLPRPDTAGTRPGQGLGGIGTEIVQLDLVGASPGLGLIQITPATELRDQGFIQGQGGPGLTLLDLADLPDRVFPNDPLPDFVRDAILLRIVEATLDRLAAQDAESGGLSSGRVIGFGSGSSFGPEQWGMLTTTRGTGSEDPTALQWQQILAPLDGEPSFVNDPTVPKVVRFIFGRAPGEGDPAVGIFDVNSDVENPQVIFEGGSSIGDTTAWSFTTPDRLAPPPAGGTAQIRTNQLRTTQAGAAVCTTDCIYAILRSDEPGNDSAVILIDPLQWPAGPNLTITGDESWTQVDRGIPNGHLGLSATMRDLNGDGIHDLIIGVPGGSATDLDDNPPPSDASGVAYVLLGPITSAPLVEQVVRIYGGAPAGERFGGDVEIGDLTGNGLPDIVITSRFHRRNGIGSQRAAAYVFPSAPPVITDVAVVDGETVITGRNLDGNVRLDGISATVVSAAPGRIVVQGSGDVVEVIGLFGVAQVGGERSVPLQTGFNLVGWTGDTAIQDALATVDGSFSGVFTWDPLTESFRSFSPSAPDFINTLDELLLGDGLWINIDDPSGAVWTQPNFTAERLVDLVAGLQLAIWTGPNGTPILDALGGIAANVVQVLVWDPLAAAFLAFNASLPAALNSLALLNFGDAFWIEVDSAVQWLQPPR